MVCSTYLITLISHKWRDWISSIVCPYEAHEARCSRTCYEKIPTVDGPTFDLVCTLLWHRKRWKNWSVIHEHAYSCKSSPSSSRKYFNAASLFCPEHGIHHLLFLSAVFFKSIESFPAFFLLGSTYLILPRSALCRVFSAMTNPCTVDSIEGCSQNCGRCFVPRNEFET